MSEKFGNPAALGLAAFALTTFLLSLTNAKLAPPHLLYLIVPTALIYGGAAQLIAGIIDLVKTGSTFGGTAFCSYGAFWISLGIAELLKARGVWYYYEHEMGLFLIAWTIFTFYMWIGTRKLGRELKSLFTLLLLTFIALDVGHVLHPYVEVANTIGGYIGILTAFNAWYISATIVLKGGHH
ncbi:MAG: acetate uptake transporter [Candidatus Nezhaarchaeales archaeon]